MKAPRTTSGWTWKKILEDEKKGDPTDFGPSYLSMLEAAYREGYEDGYRKGGDDGADNGLVAKIKQNLERRLEETEAWQESETLKNNQ